MRRANPPPYESYRLCIDIAHKGCKAIHRQVHRTHVRFMEISQFKRPPIKMSNGARNNSMQSCRTEALSFSFVNELIQAKKIIHKIKATST
jgi:hypothetical protein